jgi:hypothetical protein
MPNAWVEHVRQYASNNDLSYACALSTPDCRETYQRPENYTRQLNRIATLLRNNRRNEPPTPAKVQQARDLFNQVRVLINAMPASTTKTSYMTRLGFSRNRIQSLI